MSSVSIRQTTQFKIEKLELIINDNNLALDGLFSEINLFDNLFMPCVSGNILIIDALGLSDRLKLNGREKIRVVISKDGGDALQYDKEFVIYSLTDKKNLNMSSVTYILNFVSEEYVYSLQQKISQTYINDPYHVIAFKILNDYLQVPNSSPANGRAGIGIFYPSEGVQDLIFPTITPFDAINFVSQKAVSQRNSTPDFLFFETAQLGYNFVPLSYLIEEQSVLFNINFKPKNIGNAASDNFDEFLGARDLKVLSQFSVLESVKDGVYSGKFIGFDTLTKTTKITTIKNTADAMFKRNKGSFTGLALDAESKDGQFYSEMDESRIVSYPFSLPRTTVEYIKNNDPQAYTMIDNSQDYVFQRKAIFSNLMQRRIQLVMPGNFGLFSSRLINLRVPKFSAAIGDEPLDKSLSGKYIITGTRHIIKPDRHETIIEVSTDRITT